MRYSLKLLLSLLLFWAISISSVTASQCTTEDWDPNTCGGAYCTVYFMDPLCFLTSCSYSDWVPAICDTAGLSREYCEVYPSDTTNCP